MKSVSKQHLIKLEQRLAQGLYRSLPKRSGGIDFASNDYLGMANNPMLATRLDSLLPHGAALGSTGSRLLTGNSDLHEQTEHYLAVWVGAPEALLFASGYMANLALFSTLPQKGDLVLLDEHIHACIKDGLRLSFAEKQYFRHNDLEDLEKKLRRSSGQYQNLYVGVESVYSMQGDVAPLIEMAALCNRFNACLIVDEAHSTGVVGGEGAGLCVELGISEDCLAIVYTFGKAMGTHGAFVSCSSKLKEYLINFSRPFIYTTAPPVHQVLAMKASVSLLREHPEWADQLRQLIRHLHGHDLLPALGELGARLQPKPFAVQPIEIGDAHLVRILSTRLFEAGYDCRAVVAPTVPQGEECLRLVLHAFNTTVELDGFLAHLLHIMKQENRVE
jgi:8-amino-7-oxononanoate synthase